MEGPQSLTSLPAKKIKAHYKHKGMLICKEMTSNYLLHQVEVNSVQPN